MSAQPLSAASARLRGKPGRPQKPSPDPLAPLAVAAAGLPPRLLTIEGAATYMGGVSPWTIRDLIANGTLPKVTIPLANGRELRRVLIDRADIDALVERSKERRV